MRDPRCPGAIPFPKTGPIYGLTADGLCACSRPTCAGPGKHQRLYGAPVALNGEGYAIYTGAAGEHGSGVFVVDCDEKPGISGFANFRNLCLQHGHDIPDTLMVVSGGGGVHFFFQAPEFPVKSSKSGALGKGIDIKGEGGYVVGPGSPHKSGNAYYVWRDAPVAIAPKWLLDWPGLRRTSKTIDELDPSDLGAYAPAFIDPSTPVGAFRIASFVAECKGEAGTLKPSIEGEGGSARLVHAAKRGTLYWQIEPVLCAAIMLDHFVPRCIDRGRPWTHDEVHRACIRAVQTNEDVSPGPIPDNWGQDLLRAAITGLTPAQLDTSIAPRVPGEHAAHCTCGGGSEHRYKIRAGESIANGKILPKSFSELVFYLHRHPDWQGVLRYDAMHERIRAVQPPVHLDGEDNFEGVTEVDVGRAKIWMECVADASVSFDALWPAVEAAAKLHEFHPVKDYFNALPAGNPRVFDTLAHEWFGVPKDDLLSHEMLKRFLVASVRRTLWPNTDLAKVDTALVLIEPTGGAKKTTFIDAMWHREWAVHQLPNFDKAADMSNQISRKAVAEFGEIERILRQDPETFKDFLTREWDEFRRAYARDTVVKPRTCVIVATTNKERYVRSDCDDAVLRRLWSIRVRRIIPLDLVREMRDEVWAAAVGLAHDSQFHHWFDKGDRWDVALMSLHKQDHVQEDTWTDDVLNYCIGKTFVTGAEVFRFAIAKGDLNWLLTYGRDKSAQWKVGSCLRSIGCEEGVTRDKSTQRLIRGWKVPEAVTNARPTADALREKTITEGRTLSVLTNEAKGV